MNLYPYFKQVALDSGAADNVDLNTDSIKVLALNGHTFDSADKYVSDVLADAGTTEVARSGALTTPTVTNGTFDADDASIAAGQVNAGETITDLVLYKDTGADASSPVICHIDQDQAAAALSLPGNGSAVTISWDAAGIFDL
jgi:hypothetical protein